MRICMVSFSTNPSLQHYLANASKMLEEFGNDVMTIGSLQQHIKEIAYPQNRLLVDTPLRPTFEWRTIRDLANAKYAAMKAKEFDPEVIHFISPHTWNLIMYKLLETKSRSISFFHTVHDPVGHNGEKVQYLMKIYNKLLCKTMDGIILHNRRGYLDLNNNSTKARFFYSPLGEMKWKNFASPEKNKTALFFGRLSAYKGCEYIREIASQVAALDPEIKLVIAGKPAGGLSRRELRLLKELDNISLFDSFVPEHMVSHLFHKADIVTIMHTSISQSGVILQAYRHSRPVIAFDIYGIREFVEDGENGLLVSRFDTSSYARKLCVFLNSKELIDTMSRKAWESGREKFSLENMAKDFLRFYKEIYEDGPR